MDSYDNRSGTSGVEAYECGDDWIKVRFRRGRIYVYDYATPGAIRVEHLKELARSGRGLGTYISRHLRNGYARVEP